MAEKRVTVVGETRPLPAPFYVIATQNPIELEGTYPLPEAQLDRFLFKLDVPPVDHTVLARILMERRAGRPPELSPVVDAAGLDALFQVVDQVFLPQAVAEFTARLVAASHPSSAQAPAEVREYVRHGASPRAAIAIAEAARAHALIQGKPNVGFDNVRAVSAHAMAHRLVLDYRARLDGRTGREVVAAILQAVPEV